MTLQFAMLPKRLFRTENREELQQISLQKNLR